MENKSEVLVLAKGDDSQLAMLNDVPHLVGHETAAFADAAKDATAILNWSASRELLRAVFAICPRLEWVHSRAAGLDTVLFPELIESDVTLTNSRGIFSAALGEFALAAILYFAKDFRRMIRNQAAGVWERFDVDEVAGQTVGVVGYGDIGREVATRVHAMGMRVVAMRRSIPEAADSLIDEYYAPSGLHTMLARCDAIVATAPLTDETRHMIGEAEFAVMKPTAVVINVGRGAVIDEAALVRALTDRRIKGAGLDVYEHEPLPAGHPLYGLENVLLSPHCADNTTDWKDQAMRFFVEQYGRYLRGEPLKNIVNKRLGY